MEILIPEEWFHGLHIVALVAIGSAALWVLAKGADWLVEAASELAVQLGMPKVIVGATIVSLGTTTPECAVSVMAAWAGNSGLALGNAVGSVIFDGAIIFGVGCLATILPADRFLLQRQGWVQFGSGVLLAAFCYVSYFVRGDDATIPRWMGAVFLALLGIYLWLSVVWSRQRMSVPALATEAETLVPDRPRHSYLSLFGKMLAGLVLVLFGSHITIICVTLIAQRLQVPDVVISATVVACGTSLPECIVAISAIRKRHPELLVGNVIGADILNILFVTGAAALAKDLPIVDPNAADPAVFLKLTLPTMLIMLVWFRICIARAIGPGHFERWMGVPLVVGWIIFTVASLSVGSSPH